MNVVLSTPGKFHTFDLARELDKQSMLKAIFTGYPHFKLTSEQLSKEKILSFPWVHTPYMRKPSWVPQLISQQWEYWDKVTLDRYVSRHMPECDLFVGLSGSALESGRKAKAIGAKYVCDRGSSHIRAQDTLLREERALWGGPDQSVDPRIIAREEAEYAEANCITVPSTFNVNTFISQGVPTQKIQRLSYGVNLTTFHPTAQPQPDQFNVLFVGGLSLRKGVQYLLQAYKQLQHPKKTLTFAGAASTEFISLMKQHGVWVPEVNLLGHVPQTQLKDLMSKSHALVLPSIEEGLAMVQAQAMACGCPIISSTNTGAEDLISDAKEGFIVPIRNVDALTQKMQQLADHPSLQLAMRQASLQKVQSIGGWSTYGQQAISLYQALIK